MKQGLKTVLFSNFEIEGQGGGFFGQQLHKAPLNRAVVKRALKPNTEIILPKSLIGQIISSAIKRPNLDYRDIAEFIRDSVKNFINRHGKWHISLFKL